MLSFLLGLYWAMVILTKHCTKYIWSLLWIFCKGNQSPRNIIMNTYLRNESKHRKIYFPFLDTLFRPVNSLRKLSFVIIKIIWNMQVERNALNLNIFFLNLPSFFLVEAIGLCPQSTNVTFPVFISNKFNTQNYRFFFFFSRLGTRKFQSTRSACFLR